MECKFPQFCHSSRSDHSINRNIVECKLSNGLLITAFSGRINRNIVECKSVGILIDFELESVLIETLWNVNITEEYLADDL